MSIIPVKAKPFILPIIILTQFACTSTWFAGKAILASLTERFDLGSGTLGYISSSVQFDFIVGTLLLDLPMVADRYSPSKVFMISAVLASLSNILLIAPELNLWGLITVRCFTGFFLAGIYPVGMKIAADHYQNGLGKALGFMVGALVLGTSFPFLLNGSKLSDKQDLVIQITSAITLFGGIILFILIPNGPFRVPSKRLKLDTAPLLFKNSSFKRATFGYFGHMWELYAFWAFTPVALTWFNAQTENGIPISLLTGIIIAVGGISCAIGGLLTKRFGSRNVALIALMASGLFCLLSPLLFTLSTALFLSGFYLWGIVVTADSPQFSSLITASVHPELKGTALTLSTCIGF